MRAHWRYLKYVLRHKYYVFLAGRKLGVPLRQLILHDWTKFLPSEWLPYVNFFYGDKSKEGVKEAFDRAWLHHQNRNRHHWQYWMLAFDNGNTELLTMPRHDLAEMVADWAGAGRAITGRWEVRSWYESNRDRIKLHPATRHAVEALLLDFKPC